MTLQLCLKATVVWLIIAVLAIVNGVIRERFFVPLWGSHIALPLSGITLSLLVVITCYLLFDLLKTPYSGGYIGVGIQWVVMTVAFEFLFGHFVVHKSWAALFHSFNIASGDLFSLVLVVSAMSPYTIAKIKGLI